MILMWCLAMAMAYMFYYYAVRAPRGKMQADLIGVGPTIVFALPFVRDAVPGGLLQVASLVGSEPELTLGSRNRHTTGRRSFRLCRIFLV